MKKVIIFIIIYAVLGIFNTFSSTSAMFEFNGKSFKLDIKNSSFRSISEVIIKENKFEINLNSLMNIKSTHFYLGQLTDYGEVDMSEIDSKNTNFGFFHKINDVFSASVLFRPLGLAFHYFNNDYKFVFIHFRKREKMIMEKYIQDYDMVKESTNPFLIKTEINKKNKLFTLTFYMLNVFDRDYGLYSELNSSLTFKMKSITSSFFTFLSNKKREDKINFSVKTNEFTLKLESDKEIYSKPIYGGTSQQIKLKYENTFGFKDFTISIIHTKSFEETTGNKSETDYKIRLKFTKNSITFKTSLNRTEGGNKVFHNFEIGLILNNLEIKIINFKKISFIYTYKENNYTIKYGNDRNISGIRMLFEFKDY